VTPHESVACACPMVALTQVVIVTGGGT